MVDRDQIKVTVATYKSQIFELYKEMKDRLKDEEQIQ
jgi:hypothetical protein